jgi:hypothetical protein
MRIMWGARVGRLMGASEMVGELIVCLPPMRYGRDAAADDSRQPLMSELGTRRETRVGFTDSLLLRGAFAWHGAASSFTPCIGFTNSPLLCIINLLVQTTPASFAASTSSSLLVEIAVFLCTVLEV